MKKMLLFFIFASSSFVSSQSINATTESGEKVILNENGTWDYLEKDDKDSKTPVKFISCKIEKKIKDFSRDSKPYKAHVRAYFQFENLSSKTTSGIQFKFYFKDAFGDVLYESSSKSNIIIKPNKKNSMNTFFYWEDNEFLAGEPYDMLQSAAGAGTIRTEVEIISVVFDDGAIFKN
tara:strand:- start:170 stop:700 length:531 start_codon:yes stop_codon:yes gene_type:complete